MSSNSCRIIPQAHRSRAAIFILATCLRLVGGCFGAEEASRVNADSSVAQDKVLTNFDQIWQLSEAEQREWHRVRFEYVVYYYDPL